MQISSLKFEPKPRFPRRPWSKHPKHQRIIRTEACFFGTAHDWADALRLDLGSIRKRISAHGTVLPRKSRKGS